MKRKHFIIYFFIITAQYYFHYYPYLSTDEWNTEAEDNIQNKALRLIYYMLLDLRFM